ncbi:MFS transporter [Aquabacterium sp. OR-4]|uniref:MFS transporter n=1 Tax=Aquabacterium sp. OR-4 TaxID=2978127 RepID=UPI0021B303AF|nr:MFS transporter [Aquabacterium sp. OR-4]MDT7834887.1 MFS transporter [Aquabacterium sp. OR-4]
MTHWPAVLAAAGAGVAIALNVGKVPLAIGALRAELGLSLVQAGWVSSALVTLAVCAALAVGLVAGRLGALRLLLGGLLLGGLASLSITLLPPALLAGQAGAAGAAGAGAGSAGAGFGWLLAARLAEGAGFLAVAATAPTLISAAAAPADRRFALGVWATYLPAGAGLAMALSPLLLALAGWRGLWWLASAGLFTAAAAAWLQRAHYAGAAPGSHAGDWRPTLAVLRQPLPWLYGLAFGLWALQHFALIVWMPSFLREQRGLAPASVALLTCTMLLACVPGNLIGGMLVQRGVSRGRLIVATHAATGLLGLGCFSAVLPDGLRFACSVALSFAGGLIPAAALSASVALARTPAQIGAVQGAVMQCSQLGQFIGTPLIAAVVAASGQWASARWVTAGAAALGMLLGGLALRAERRLQAG